MIRSVSLHTRTWARAIVTTYGFNSAGDLTSVDYGDSTQDVTRTVRRDGSPATVIDAAGTTTYAYSGAVATGEAAFAGASGPRGRDRLLFFKCAVMTSALAERALSLLIFGCLPDRVGNREPAGIASELG